jgi:hypothetical protein
MLTSVELFEKYNKVKINGKPYFFEINVKCEEN